jgi:lipopolysaccharide export system protein LptA
LEKGKAVLITDKLDYDVKNKRGWFQNGGKLISDSTLLISQQGEYFAQNGDANFYQKVKVTNPAYTLQADTFQFNTEQKINYFHGPTYIQLDTNQVYCEGGKYELTSGNSLFTKNASLKNKRQSLFGDSISWNKKTSSGWAAGKVRLTDTLEQTSITAAHLILKNNPKKVIAFGVPWLTLYSTKDTVYINADTLFAVTFQQKAVAKDTFNNRDSISVNLLRAWNNVHLYNRQFQAVSDSASYSSLDSVFRLFHHPILWIDSSQLFADTVYLIQKNKIIQQIQLLQNAFIASHIVSNYYNQLSGKKIIGYFADNKLSSLFVKGSAKSLYFSQEENGAFAGINKSASSSMKVVFEEGKVSQIRFYGQPDAAFSPIIHYPKSELFFKEFKWQPALRPSRAMVGK